MNLESLNEGQRRSVTHLDGPLLICAGAGSGKTYTLTQRVAWALQPGSAADGGAYLSSIDEVLMITFTDKAAGEMRGRVRSTLRQLGMEAESLKVDAAWISTIHGMCIRLLKENAVALGIDPAVTMLMGADAELLLDAALQETIREARESGRWPRLVSEATNTQLTKVIGSLIAEANRLTRRFDAILCPPPLETSLALSLLDEMVAACLTLSLGKNKTAEAAAIALEALAPLQAACEEARSEMGDELRAEVLDALEGIKPGAFRGKAEEVARFKDSLGYLKAALQADAARAFAEEAVEAARACDARYQRLLAEQGAYDGNTLLYATLQALESHPELARSYRERFRLIMVDEFQDTSQLQIDLITALAGEDLAHLCTVGDSQQSIYRFNGANVEVYIEHKADMASKANISLVNLDANYRSHRDVLSYVRSVCGAPGYFKEDFLDLSAGTEGTPWKLDAPRIEVALTTFPNGRTDQAAEAEAAHIAERFGALHEAGHPYSDMVVLMGTTTKSDIIARTLRERGIPCVVAGGSRFFKGAVAALCRSIVAVLANPLDSEHLVSLLASEVLPVSSDDLLLLSTSLRADGSAIRQSPSLGMLFSEPSKDGAACAFDALEGGSELARHARMVLRRAWQATPHRSPAEVFLQVATESGWLGRLEAAGVEGLAQAADVLKFAQIIEEASAGGRRGFGWIRERIEALAESGTEKPGALSAESSEAVRLMTAHSSKGLAFPIVAVTDCYLVKPERDAFRTLIEGASLCVTHAPSGFKLPESLAAEAPDEPKRATDPALWRASIGAVEAQRSYEELKRLFYVAITRASAGLIVCVRHKRTKNDALSDVERDIARGLGNPLAFPEASCPLSVDGGSCPVTFWRTDLPEKGAEGDGASAPEAGGQAAKAPNASQGRGAGEHENPEGEGSPVVAASIAERSFALCEPVDLPRRTVRPALQERGFFSYSQMAHDLEGQAAGAQFTSGSDPTSEQGGEDVPLAREAILHRGEAGGVDLEAYGSEDALPARSTLRDADAATEFGSAVHRCLEAIALRHGRIDEAALDRLLARVAGIYGIADHARLEAAVRAWLRSTWSERASAHARMRPEVPFALAIGEETLEGSIDLLCDDPDAPGSALIIDYKTGGSPAEDDEALLHKHELQASCYALASLEAGYEEITAVFVRVEQVHGGEPEAVEYRFTAADAERLRERIAQIRQNSAKLS